MKMTDKYIDPENVQEIIENVKNCPTIKDINDLINKIFPDWILYYLVKYSDDYPHLEYNWNSTVKTYNLRKGKILIVDEIVKDDSHLLIDLFCNIYTQIGFIVRTKDEILPCKVCDKAIPSQESYNKMKELNMNIPEKWDSKCINCV